MLRMVCGKPIIGITMGDPAGIGPEISVKVLTHPEVWQMCNPLIVGDAGVIRQAVQIVQTKMAVRAINGMSQAQFTPEQINVIDLNNVDMTTFQRGRVSAMAGHAAFEAVRTAIELARTGAIDATVTAPIHKEALVLAGHHFPGHTEIFAHFTGCRDVTMMLAAGKFRVVHVSTHVSLRQACDAVTRERVLKVIELAYNGCRQLGIENPKIGVAGLNPHASDGGLFGTEEQDHIIPAVEAARARGMLVEGPQPPDTFFAKAASGVYDICVAMYHDQGHIPVKMCGFKFDPASMTWTSVNGINVSLGLPIIRASVDHGTAFDQAGTGQASEASLLDAIEYASRMARSGLKQP